MPSTAAVTDTGQAHQPLRLGLVSTARINGAILGAAGQTDRVEIVAVASRDASRARAYAQHHGITRSYGDYDGLLADPEVDAVYISLPNAMHVPWTMHALEAGKHVLCEKPFSTDPAQVTECFDEADRRGLVLSEAFMWRHHPQARRLTELVADGAIGELRMIRASFAFLLADRADIRLDRELAGGALMDVGCYCVSACRLLAGEPQRLYGEAVRAESGLDLRFAATMRFEHDVLATFDCGFDVVANHDLEVTGSEGSLFLGDPWHGREAAIEHRRAGHDVQRIELGHADSYVHQLEDFAGAVAERRAPRLGRADALGQARAIAALYESAARGAPVGLAGTATTVEREDTR